jgi:hypothetical protein
MLQIPVEKSLLSWKELESQILQSVAIHYAVGDRRPDPHSAQRPNGPHHDGRTAPVPPSESRTPAPSLTITRTLQEVTYPAYSSLTNPAGAPGEKNLKTPTIGA